MDQSFAPLTKSHPPEGKDVEFWAYGKVRVGQRRDGRYWVDGKSIVVEGWRFIVKPKKVPPVKTVVVQMIGGGGGGGGASGQNAGSGGGAGTTGASGTGGAGGAGEYIEPAKPGRKKKTSA